MELAGKLAVVTGAGSGMGRELTRQLAGAGCRVAICDLNAATMAETCELAGRDAVGGARVTSFVADVSDEDQVRAFADAVRRDHAVDHIDLLFNNAGVGGGESFVVGDRAQWERTFQVCWKSVYNGTRAFLPMLLASTEGHVVNMSSLNGFYASLGPYSPVTAYSAAKFAVKGFTESLVTDFRLHAPHLRASVVMPGSVGTSISINTARFHGGDAEHLSGVDLEPARARLRGLGVAVDELDDEGVRRETLDQATAFDEQSLMTSAEAARIILVGVRAGRLRILVGDDAVIIDRFVRRHPELAYAVDRKSVMLLIAARVAVPVRVRQALRRIRRRRSSPRA